MSRPHPYGGYDDAAGGRRGRRGGRGGRGHGRGRGVGGAGAPDPRAAYPFGAMPMPMPMPWAPPFPPWAPPFPYAMGGMPMPAWDAPRARRGAERRSRGAERRPARPRFTRSVYQPEPGAARPEDSKPCRTLFVRNVAFEVDESTLRADFASFGEIRTWFDLVQRRGMLFVTYYDTRAAEQARVTMNGKMYFGRALDVHFSLPKDEDQQQHCNRDKNQGTLFVALDGAPAPLTDELLRAELAPFGDIRAMRTYKDHTNARFVEFWDSRACVAAFDALQGQPRWGGTLQLKFAWDLATVSLVSDARTRSEAKAAAEARAAAPPEATAPALWAPSAPPPPPPEERLEHAQQVQQVRRTTHAAPGHDGTWPRGAERCAGRARAG